MHNHLQVSTGKASKVPISAVLPYALGALLPNAFKNLFDENLYSHTDAACKVEIRRRGPAWFYSSSAQSSGNQRLTFRNTALADILKQSLVLADDPLPKSASLGRAYDVDIDAGGSATPAAELLFTHLSKVVPIHFIKTTKSAPLLSLRIEDADLVKKRIALANEIAEHSSTEAKPLSALQWLHLTAATQAKFKQVKFAFAGEVPSPFVFKQPKAMMTTLKELIQMIKNNGFAVEVSWYNLDAYRVEVK